MTLRVMCLGDIVGRPGRRAVIDSVGRLTREYSADLVIANGENSAGGSGITETIFEAYLEAGVHVVTLGDHAFRRSEIYTALDESPRVLRPANLAKAAPGRPFTILSVGGVSVGIFCLLGRMNMDLLANDPFAQAEAVLAEMPADTAVRICEFHAETTSEKVAMGHFLDGRVSLIYGTHTHVPTADAKILPGGSAYITDIGMVGVEDSCLGRRKDRILGHMTTGMPHRFDIAEGEVLVSGIVCDIEAQTGTAQKITRIDHRLPGVESAYDADDAMVRPGQRR